MSGALGVAAMGAVIRRYYDGCNEADEAKMIGCFVPDAVETLGSWWTIDALLLDERRAAAAIESSHWKTKQQKALRGAEWVAFDRDSRLIREIRAYYASPQAAQSQRFELGGFDYVGRGYPGGVASRGVRVADFGIAAERALRSGSTRPPAWRSHRRRRGASDHLMLGAPIPTQCQAFGSRVLDRRWADSYTGLARREREKALRSVRHFINGELTASAGWPNLRQARFLSIQIALSPFDRSSGVHVNSH